MLPADLDICQGRSGGTPGGVKNEIGQHRLAILYLLELNFLDR
jgi:hypothetical protein